MDDFDHAQELEMRERERLIRENAERYPALPHTGRCHNCDEPLELFRRFCDADCRDDYEARQKAVQRNGVPLDDEETE